MISGLCCWLHCHHSRARPIGQVLLRCGIAYPDCLIFAKDVGPIRDDGLIRLQVDVMLLSCGEVSSPQSKVECAELLHSVVELDLRLLSVFANMHKRPPHIL